MSVQFIPVRGPEANIMNAGYNEGYVYFATDTKKIYLDARGQEKLLMGGSSGIFYGSLEVEEGLVGQEEFEFTLEQIEGNEDPSRLNIPQKDDLILNIPDGCFYRVNEIVGTGLTTVVHTTKLTIAGSGGGGGGSEDVNVGKFDLIRTTPANITILYGSPYSIGFKATAVDFNGDQTGNGTYTLLVGGVKRESGFVTQGVNEIPVEKYLVAGNNTVTIKVSMDIGGSSNVTKTLNYTIYTSIMELNWEYNELEVNSTEDSFILEWDVSGSNIEKTTHLLIDGLFPVVLSENKTTSNTQRYVFSADALHSYGLDHGSHVLKMWATANLNGNEVSTDAVFKTIMFEDPDEGTPIITVKLYETNLQQYDTVFIPIAIYSKTNVAGDAVFTFSENGVVLDTQRDIQNSTWYQCAYTPSTPGIHILSVRCGQGETSITVNVNALQINNEEVPGYAFKFKASNFLSNSTIQDWNSNGVTASFSDKFDWINGGLKSEIVDGASRQYMCIKAGSQMTINYPLFKTPPQAAGKTFKMIFKAAKCRDYDAQVLTCRENRKGVGINTDTFIDLEIASQTEILFSRFAQLNDTKTQITLSNAETITFDLDDESFRTTIAQTFIEYENKIYYCPEVKEVEEDGEIFYYIQWHEAIIEDTFLGLEMKAQNTIFNSLSSSLSVPYCEDSYIEFEIDISKYNQNGKMYIRTWMDGVPCGIQNYTLNDSFTQDNPQNIVIGSDDCDVYLYMIKVYEKGLSDDEHLANFIADAPNGNEMFKRYQRNDILNIETGEISPTKLAMVNKDCRVHIYDLERMTQNKKDPVQCYSYAQYHGSDQAVLSAPSAVVKVQGTSSAAYGLAAYNLDAEFEEGFNDANGNHLDVWSMNENSIGCNYFTTKVNVASCENANNALNQEWYNRFQPYKCVLRCKNPNARDTMEFTPGALFIIDRNKTYDPEGSVLTANNVFGDTPGYTNNPYAKLYAICNMGNSKNNTHVFHDQSNPLECCVEVGDNQQPQQWMVSDQFGTGDIDDGKEYYGFRYPDKAKNASETMIQGWKDFVSWMAHSNPQPMYEEIEILSAEDFAEAKINKYTGKPVTLYTFKDPENGTHTVVTEYDASTTKYYKKTQNIYGYTNEKLPESKSFNAYTFTGYYAPGYESLQKAAGYVPKIKGCTVTQYATKKMVYDYKLDEDGNIMYDEDGAPIIDESTGREVDTPYTHDTYEYRMAKMLSECEQHLCMDSVIYHYLFIERHCMIDNVAKNTFWSTEDCRVWNLIKDYDNDTADGNDNNGKFTRNYGMEALDKLNSNEFVFNAHQSVWLNFIHGLLEAREWMYKALEAVEIDGKTYNAWDPKSYLTLFEEWQSVIPERVWIQDYYRKYIRPYEVYNDDMFLPMMEGGQKKHQRSQYETYQDYYVSSEYHGQTSSSSWILIRGNGNDKLGYKLPVTLYADCYIRAAIGSGQNPNIRVRAKRNRTEYIECPMAELNNTTFYIYLPQLYQSIGEVNGNNLSGFAPAQFSIVQAPKLRTVVLGTVDSVKNDGLNTVGFENNDLLEVLYAANCPAAKVGLNLSKAPSLKELDVRGSGFTEITIANNAPVETIRLESPTTISLSNLTELKTLEIKQPLSIQQLYFDNIDKSQINSKDYVDAAINLNRYYLRDIDWVLNNSNDVNSTELTVSIIERLKKLKPMLNPATGLEYPLSASLTGNVEITSNAYDGEESFDIYNKYAQLEVYPNLNLDFTDEKSKLYNVSIYGGNDDVAWFRKITQNGLINEEFLSDGPNGEFDVNNIYKQPTDAKVYNFTGKWFVYKASDLTMKVDEFTGDPGNGYMPYYSKPVEYDIVLKPEFTELTRQYTLTFYKNEGLTQKEEVIADYGTLLTDIMPTDLPYKEYFGNNIKSDYDFIGYSLLQGATLVPENYQVRNNQAFYPNFKLIDDISTVVHYEWFNFEPASYTQYKTDYDSGLYGLPYNDEYIQYALSNQLAYRVTPKVKLKGKITIPAKHPTDGLPVIIVGNMSNTEITHVFFEKDNKILSIATNAFLNLSTLKYVDFKSMPELQMIGGSAFQNCQNINADLTSENVSLFNLGTKIYRINNNAFNNALTSTNLTTIEIPSSVLFIGYGAFTVTGLLKGSTLRIGSNDNPSSIDFANGTSGSNVSRFGQNFNNMYSVVEFYSTRYDTPEDPITANYAVWNVFVYSEEDRITTHIDVMKRGG